jgi:hypothetical protein
MRARNIKPSIFSNETLGDCGPIATLLFVGLWTIADREGLLDDRPRRIKAQVLPYYDADVDALLDTLHSAGFIRRYTVDGGAYICVTNFSKHQRPHTNEAASTIPPPPPPGLVTKVASACNQGEKDLQPRESSRVVSGIRYPVSGINEEGSADPTPDADDRFTEWWALYPHYGRRSVKRDALARWKRLVREGVDPEDIIKLTTLRADERDWRKNGGEYVPGAQVFLSRTDWTDPDTYKVTVYDDDDEPPLWIPDDDEEEEK